MTNVTSSEAREQRAETEACFLCPLRARGWAEFPGSSSVQGFSIRSPL